MSDYLDVLQHADWAAACPAGLPWFAADPAVSSGLIDLGVFGGAGGRTNQIDLSMFDQGGGRSGLVDLGVFGQGARSGLMNWDAFSGSNAGPTGGLLNLSAFSQNTINPFEMIKNMGSPFSRIGLDPAKDAAAAAAARGTAGGYSGAGAVVPATIPESARALISEAGNTDLGPRGAPDRRGDGARVDELQP